MVRTLLFLLCGLEVSVWRAWSGFRSFREAVVAGSWACHTDLSCVIVSVFLQFLKAAMLLFPPPRYSSLKRSFRPSRIRQCFGQSSKSSKPKSSALIRRYEL